LRDCTVGFVATRAIMPSLTNPISVFLSLR